MLNIVGAEKRSRTVDLLITNPIQYNTTQQRPNINENKNSYLRLVRLLCSFLTRPLLMRGSGPSLDHQSISLKCLDLTSPPLLGFLHHTPNPRYPGLH